MPLIKDGALAEDPWVEVPDDGSIPEDRRAIVSLARWRRERERLAARTAPLGVRLRNTDDVRELGDDLRRIGLIALEFPKFADGRAYSQARILRERLAYAGELRATGEVLQDQALFLRRCGFDAFEVRGEADLDGWRRAFGAIGRFYQPAADGLRPISALRGDE